MTLARPLTRVPGIDRHHQLVNGLRGAWLGEPQSSLVLDRVGTAHLAKNGTPDWTGSSVGYALRHDSGGDGFQNDSIPSYLQLTHPITLGLFCMPLGAPDNLSDVWGLRPDIDEGSPFVSAAIAYASSGTEWRWFTNSSGSFVNRGTGIDHSTFIGINTLVLMTFDTNELQAWINDDYAIDTTTLASPTYGSNPTLGTQASASRNSNMLIHATWIWDRKLDDEDYKRLRSDPFEMFRPLRFRIITAPPSVGGLTGQTKQVGHAGGQAGYGGGQAA